MDHQPLRISIRRYLLSPWLNINGYAKITKRDTEVKNGMYGCGKRPPDLCGICRCYSSNQPSPCPSTLNLSGGFLVPKSVFLCSESLGLWRGWLRHFCQQTSAIQRVGLTSAIDRWYVHGEHGTPGSYHGARTVTFFAPESKAFQHLPKKLRLFLFSPFGEKALKKLLEYHIVPDFTLFSGAPRPCFDVGTVLFDRSF